MFLNLLVPTYQKYINIVITQNTTFTQLLDTIIKRCEEFCVICDRKNIRCVIDDFLITEENWINFKNNNNYKNLNGIIIIVPIKCRKHIA
tara:strand:+ start:394 stop:663 length:270 start_codon:yes stop_codon:yes gene_type:complete